MIEIPVYINSVVGISVLVNSCHLCPNHDMIKTIIDMHNYWLNKEKYMEIYMSPLYVIAYKFCPFLAFVKSKSKFVTTWLFFLSTYLIAEFWHITPATDYMFSHPENWICRNCRFISNIEDFQRILIGLQRKTPAKLISPMCIFEFAKNCLENIDS